MNAPAPLINLALRQPRQTWIALACLSLTLAWVARLLWLDLPCRPPTYLIPGGSDPVDVFAYSKLLADHNPLLTCMTVTYALIALLALVGIGLMIRPGTSPIDVAILAVLTGAVTCFGLFASVWSGDGTTLQEIQTTEYNGRVYHLVVADVVTGGMDVYAQPIYLFDCAPPGEVCLATNLAYLNNHAANTPTLELDPSTHHLIVRNGPTVIYTQSAP